MIATSKHTVTDLLSSYPTLTTASEIHKKIQSLLHQKSGGYYIALNPEKIFLSLRDQKLEKILSESRFIFIDGVGAKWAYKFLLNRSVEVINGVDLLTSTIQKNASLRIGLFGAEPGIAQKTSEILQKQFPQSNIVFALSGYEPDRANIGKTIEQFQPDIVFVALGSPAQEDWISAHQSQFPAVLFTGVGGSFDVISGRIQRAPSLVRKLGLEWLYRFLRQPFKRWKRMTVLFRFLILVFKNKVIQ